MAEQLADIQVQAGLYEAAAETRENLPVDSIVRTDMVRAYAEWKISPSEQSITGLRASIKEAVDTALSIDPKQNEGGNNREQRNTVLREAAQMAFALGDYGRGYPRDDIEPYSVLNIARQIRNYRDEQSWELSHYARILANKGQLTEATVLAQAIEDPKSRWSESFAIARGYAKRGDKRNAERILEHARLSVLAQEPYSDPWHREKRMDIYGDEGALHFEMYGETSSFIETAILDEIRRSEEHTTRERKIKLLTMAAQALHKAGAEASSLLMLSQAFDEANAIPKKTNRWDTETRRESALYAVASTAKQVGNQEMLQQIITSGDLSYFTEDHFQNESIREALQAGNLDTAVQIVEQMTSVFSDYTRADVMLALIEDGQIDRASAMLAAYEKRGSGTVSYELKVLLAIAKKQHELGHDESSAQAVERAISLITKSYGRKDEILKSATDGMVALGKEDVINDLITHSVESSYERAELRGTLAIALVRQGRVDDALSIAREITQRREETEHTKDWEVNFVTESQAYAHIVLSLLKAGRDTEAVELLPNIRNFDIRLGTLKTIADIVAERKAA